jgi:hypothetical protein
MAQNIQENQLGFKLVKVLTPGEMIATLYVDWTTTHISTFEVIKLFMTKLGKTDSNHVGGFRNAQKSMDNEQKVLFSTYCAREGLFENLYIQKTKNGLTAYKAIEKYEVIDL